MGLTLIVLTLLGKNIIFILQLKYDYNSACIQPNVLIMISSCVVLSYMLSIYAGLVRNEQKNELGFLICYRININLSKVLK